MGTRSRQGRFAAPELVVYPWPPEGGRLKSGIVATDPDVIEQPLEVLRGCLAPFVGLLLVVLALGVFAARARQARCT